MLLAASGVGYSQSVIQSVNSGSLITASSSVSIGEIVVVPENAIQSASGLIGILAQIDSTLEIPEFAVSANVTVYPNPTTAGIYFSGKENLVGETVSIFNNVGQLVREQKIASDHSVNLSELQTGIYFIQIQNRKINSFKIIKH